MRVYRAAVFAALLLFAGPLWGQDVTLTSRDGSVKVSGTLLSFDGELYRLDTEFGIATLDGALMLCNGPGCPDLTGFVSEFRISGSRTMGEVLIPALLQNFAGQKGYAVERRFVDDTHFEYRLSQNDSDVARISFRVTSTAEGFADLVADEADLVLSTREATRAEIALAKEAGLGDISVPRRARIVALDGLVPIVSRRNPISDILMEDLADTFAGKIVDWVALGAPDGPINLHLRDDLSGLAQEFRRRVLEPNGLELMDGLTFHQDNASLADAVGRDPFALGIAAFSELGNAKPVALRGDCGARAVANAANIKTEDYPLTLPLFVYVPLGRPAPAAREFLSFIRSSTAQPVSGRAGFVNLRLGEVPLAGQGQRLANAIASAGTDIDLAELQRLTTALEGTSRLTVSFRFEPGGTRLDAQSRSNVETFAEQLELGRFDNRPLTFVGFSDGEGPAQTNRRLALRRAEAVRRAVMRAAPAADRDRLMIEVEAFGEAMPMACDSSEWGKAINRRVEVWVK